ncbi:hypothetical protein HETIRDRAFT_330134 [Heterobasidion irregulare TC 32-1]|uniref:Uncharacterized protein n=1 Tax=Heterobasidion irregulare (strain TC 32-1) TaxID=747525 RepID=W4JR78_HETIT|nr:uncharacterized protein HETIRDRAFT_330134 [Heterobasidion irregulare TC 32-1]ETW76077.1 hypothetical protein HETIRDRAFT_330134 [Heterobasidion irregulare TC 32-1]
MPDRHSRRIRNIHFNELDLVPAFLCRDRKIELYTHVKASHLLYHLGSKALTGTYEAEGKSSSYCSSIFESGRSRCQDLIFFANVMYFIDSHVSKLLQVPATNKK